jgi:hypothetical protein
MHNQGIIISNVQKPKSMSNSKISSRILNAVMVVFILSYFSCVSISSFDQFAYAQTTSVKVDGLNLMDKATEDFSSHQESVSQYKTQLQKVYEYEKNRPKNEITIKLWDKLLDPNGHLLGGFLNRWEKEKKLSATFITEEKKLVDQAFDQIAGLESKKIKSSDIPK